MAFNIFKKKKPEKIREIEKPVEKKSQKQFEKKESRFISGVLKSPRITEKATGLGSLDQYTFEVFPGANKTEIKKAVQGLYGVDVISVKILNIPRKERRFKGKIGWTAGFKKSIVRIKQGQKIEILPR